MSVEIVIIYGAIIGFIASKIWGSSFGLWWDIYLGVAGATFASCLIISAYFMKVLTNRDIVGMNLYSITVDIIGALILIYTARFYRETIKLSIKTYNHALGHKLARPSLKIMLRGLSKTKNSLIIKKLANHTYI